MPSSVIGRLISGSFTVASAASTRSRVTVLAGALEVSDMVGRV